MGKTIYNQHFVLPKLIEAIIEVYDPILEIYAKALSVDEIPMALKKVFDDGTRNWGRLVSVFAFCAQMAFQNRHKPNYLLKLEHIFVETIDFEIGYWFHSHGGWYGFQTFMEKRKSNELSLQWTHFGVVALIMIFLIYKSTQK